MSTTVLYLIKLALTILSGGILYADVKNSIHDRRNIFTGVAIASFLVFAVATLELVWHLKERDKKYPFLEYIIGTYIVKDEETLFWSENPKSLATCQRYLDRYPEGKFTPKAVSCIDEFVDAGDARSFELARSVDTIPAYQAYLANGAGARAKLAIQRIATLDASTKADAIHWEQTPKTLEGCQRYVDMHPRSSFMNAAKECINRSKEAADEANYGMAKQAGTVESYREYLMKCAANTCRSASLAQQALARLLAPEEEANWIKISITQTAQQCKEHLAMYPGGRYASRAAECVATHAFAERCAANETAAQTAKQNAINASIATGTVATLGGCGLLLVFSVIDFGASTIACAAIGGGATGGGSAIIGEKAYKETKDPACLPKPK